MGRGNPRGHLCFRGVAQSTDSFVSSEEPFSLKGHPEVPGDKVRHKQERAVVPNPGTVCLHCSGSTKLINPNGPASVQSGMGSWWSNGRCPAGEKKEMVDSLGI